MKILTSLLIASITTISAYAQQTVYSYGFNDAIGSLPAGYVAAGGSTLIAALNEGSGAFQSPTIATGDSGYYQILAIRKNEVAQSFNDAFVAGNVINFSYRVPTFGFVESGDYGRIRLDIQGDTYDSGVEHTFFNGGVQLFAENSIVNVSLTITANMVSAWNAAGGVGDARRLDFIGDSSGRSTSGSYAFDSFSIVDPLAIPEPSSFAAIAGLAALGGVALRRRRRA